MSHFSVKCNVSLGDGSSAEQVDAESSPGTSTNAELS